MKKYMISEKALLSLLEDSLELEFLKSSGVDNWEWYGEGRTEFIAECLEVSEKEVANNDYDMEYLAKQCLSEYEEVK